ncbi:hypothetical protein NOF55_04940 [Rhizobiaceae bacterium BDR2-2]|uniref:DUF1471 domain-containing protein n=1 Tax=Ectorhizobium quercum TaxID=2965071 RepID=A0AAE3MY41_9HYPH|nr:hypothetical protein [Ectorhizobium quercum]MCX8996447.1 hypothetical protein [Ectorhizobium quercum]
MNTTIKMTFAAALAAAALAPAAYAANAEGVSIVYIDSLDTGANRSTFNLLNQKAQNPNVTQEAQAEASSDPAIADQLAARSIGLHNVVEVDTAANGGKIVYVR